mgnify:CR=1 FL=1|jgi:hypothetical protein
MATQKFYGTGLFNVGSYQVSGRPFITGSSDHAVNTEVQYKFPMVTKSVTVINHTNDTIRVHFNSTSHDIDNSSVIKKNHFIELDSDEDAFTFNVKCKEIYVSCNSTGSARQYKVYAELTHIPTGSMYDLTGSGLTEG